MAVKAIIGLGNPGPQFEKTRHNAGFMVVDELARRNGCAWTRKDVFEYTTCPVAGASVILIKPLTFMNLSGDAVPFLSKKGIKPEEILVIHDELEHPFGKVTTRLGGSARGHNGLRSIIQRIGEQFHRLRVGIGRPLERSQVASYVLERFNTQELQELASLFDDAINIVEALVTDLA